MDGEFSMSNKKDENLKNVNKPKKISEWSKMIRIVACILILIGFLISLLGTIGSIIGVLLILLSLYLFRFAKKYE